MRAPARLARMEAVAAPRPEAEPVTIAHKPSFDIRISSCCCELFLNGPLGGSGIPYRVAGYLQIREVPLNGIRSLPDEHHAPFAGRPAEGACQGYGFCPS